MLDNAFGLIYTSDYNMGLKELTLMRTVASVPFGGRYRVIDFPMSNLVNSGIDSVGVITQKNYSSLMDHLSPGTDWDLNRKRDGLFILPPFSTGLTGTGLYRGTVDAFRSAMDYISHTPNRYCIYQGSHTIYTMNYEAAMAQHIEKQADITCLYNVSPPVRSNEDERLGDVRFMVQEDERIVDMEIDVRRPLSHFVSMDCIIIDKQLLEYLVDEAFGRGYIDFARDVMQKKLKDLRIYGYRYDGHVARLLSIPSYFRANMDLFDPSVREDLFERENRVYTKVKDEVPAQYKSSALVKNCIVADGCIVEGEIENCVLFRGVKIYRGAKLKNCVIMQSSEVQENAELENVILDKEVMIRRGKRLIGPENFPVVVRKLSVV